jgi:phage terminase Nu1 subunit (DNA packaging protein)
MKMSQNKKPKKAKKRTTPRPSKQSAALQDFERRIAAGEKLKRSELASYHELEKKRDKGEVVHGGQDAAKYCGTSKRILSYHIARGSLRQNPDGTFDKAELDRWLASRDRREQGPEKKKHGDAKDKAELRYRLARARREEMLVEQMKGNLASRKEIEAEWSGRVLEVASGLEALIDRLPGLLVGKSRDEIRAVLKDEVRTLRENYSRAGRYTPDAS